MYLVLLLVLSMAAFSQQQCRHHHRHNQNKIEHRAEYHSRIFEELANDVIAIDRKSQRLCEAHSNGATKELFEKNRYVLKVPLQNFTEEEIKVEVRHRAVYINAFKAETVKHYSEFRELPGFVDVSAAKFNYEDGFLEVVFPTKDTVSTSCNPHINDDVVNVPMFQIGDGQTRVRFGE
ncbi:hypothetical protein ABMA28_006688 [Loxostege sticticalis]|uniref:SHSP domain-containing protein n=1 Tax=Loxostege sticticalis TaxID=481309 RepID=A0ABD0TNF1_LOXSC